MEFELLILLILSQADLGLEAAHVEEENRLIADHVHRAQGRRPAGLVDKRARAQAGDPECGSKFAASPTETLRFARRAEESSSSGIHHVHA